MNIYSKIGVGFIVLGLVMFLVAISLFTYQGENLPPIIIKMGGVSFIFWFPIFILGLLILVFGRVLSLILKKNKFNK